MSETLEIQGFKDFNTVGEIIDAENLYFCPYIQRLPTLSDVLGLTNLLRIEYARCERMKDEILSRIDSGELSSNSETNDTIKGLYGQMKNIEDKCTLLVSERNRRRLGNEI